MFLQEVIDSLARGYDEKMNCDYLILEINSSRYAYNMSLQEVNFYVIQALFSLPPMKTPTNVLAIFKDLLVFFKPIVANYIKGLDAMMDCLRAVEVKHFEFIFKCLVTKFYFFIIPLLDVFNNL